MGAAQILIDILRSPVMTDVCVMISLKVVALTQISSSTVIYKYPVGAFPNARSTFDIYLQCFDRVPSVARARVYFKKI